VLELPDEKRGLKLVPHLTKLGEHNSDSIFAEVFTYSQPACYCPSDSLNAPLSNLIHRRIGVSLRSRALLKDPQQLLSSTAPMAQRRHPASQPTAPIDSTAAMAFALLFLLLLDGSVANGRIHRRRRRKARSSISALDPSYFTTP